MSRKWNLKNRYKGNIKMRVSEGERSWSEEKKLWAMTRPTRGCGSWEEHHDEVRGLGAQAAEWVMLLILDVVQEVETTGKTPVWESVFQEGRECLRAPQMTQWGVGRWPRAPRGRGCQSRHHGGVRGDQHVCISHHPLRSTAVGMWVGHTSEGKNFSVGIASFTIQLNNFWF